MERLRVGENMDVVGGAGKVQWVEVKATIQKMTQLHSILEHKA